MAKKFTDISKTGGDYGRGDCQYGWHSFVGNLYKNKRILDVGAGLGLSKSRLGVNGNSVTLQDPAPSLPIDISSPVEDIMDGSFDVVTAFDVVEHVILAEDFLANLVRIAREEVVVTTPNYNISKNGNPCHVREYTPEQLVDFVKDYNVKFFLVGNGSGDNAKIIKDKEEFLKHGYEHHGFVLTCSHLNP